MNWLLILHITTMLGWCGSLLYLPAFVSGAATQKNNIDTENNINISKMIFTLILTPAALITIISGTLIFITMNTTDLWLIIKLTLVTGLVICHTLNGWLIIKMDTISTKTLNFLCGFSGAFSMILIMTIFWIVLAKPALGNLI